VTDRAPNLAYTHSFSSPVGVLHAAVDKLGRVVCVGFGTEIALPGRMIGQENKYACGELEYQIEQYFTGDRQHFSLELRLEGTSFQKAVWSRLQKIGYGETVTYGEVAQRIGRREAARAVGNAVAANPVAIVVPCHRVIPAAGGIGHYARSILEEEQGRTVKRFLLALESSRHAFSETAG